MLWIHPVEFLLAKPKTKMGRMTNNNKSKHIITSTVSVSKQQGTWICRWKAVISDLSPSGPTRYPPLQHSGM